MRLATLSLLLLTALGGAQEAGRFPPALTRFSSIQQTPVFVGQPGQWDAFIRERGWIVIEDGLWKLYYTGYDSPDGIRRLVLATSKDGLAWTRHQDNPLVRDHWIEDMMIVKESGVYWMVAEGKDDLAQMLTSPKARRKSSVSTR